jgi:PAS domain S-box-containing protein
MAWQDSPYLIPLLLVAAAAGLLIARRVWGRRKSGALPAAARAAIVENMPDAIILLDRRERVIEWNRAAQRIVGASPTELVGKSLSELFAGCDLRPASSSGDSAAHSEVTLGEGARRRDYESRLSPLRDRRGRTAGWLLLLRDVTGFKRAELGLLAARQGLEKRVEERTADLARINEQLQAEVGERQRAEIALQRINLQQEQLLETARHLTASLNLRDVLTQIAVSAKDILKSYGCAIYTLQPDGRTLTPMVTIDPPYAEQAGAIDLDVDTSFTGQAVHAGQGMIFNEAWADSSGHWIPGTPEEPEERVIAAPFIVDGRVLGAMCLNRIGTQFTEDDLALAETFAAYAATALKNAQTHEELQREVTERVRAEARAQRLLSQQLTVNRLAIALGDSTDLDRTYHTVCEHICELMDVDIFAISSYAHLTHALHADFLQVDGRVWDGPDFPILMVDGKSTHIQGMVMQSGEALRVPDLHDSGRQPLDGFLEGAAGSDPACAEWHAMRAALYAPMKFEGQTVGIVQVHNRRPEVYIQDDLDLLVALGNVAAIAIQNAGLFAEIQQSNAALAAERRLLAQRVADRTVELRAANAELSAANAELAHAAIMKDEFLASMSHELRTPLHAILGMAQVLEANIYGNLSEAQARAVRTIEESGRHLLTLITDILDLARIGAGKLELESGPAPVSEVCRASLHAVRSDADKKGIALSLSIDEGISILWADERRLQQILANLLNNAVKFTPAGGQVGLDVTSDAMRPVIHFTVWDTGIGIPREQMGRLFQPFVQLDGSSTREYEGTGLGLSLVYRLTAMHGGSVSLESEIGAGSRFTISLPWQQALRAAREEAGASPPVPAVDEPRHPLVLLAESSRSDIHAITEYLERQAYRIIVAWDGAEAIRRCREDRPQVILMSRQLPGIDGLEATRRIRAIPDLTSIPIITLTDLELPGDREHCLKTGVDVYLTKPVSMPMLLQAIRSGWKRAIDRQTV